MWPSFNPSNTKINENSLICATVKPELKLVFLLNPCMPVIITIIIGFTIKTKSENTIAGTINDPRFETSNVDPRSTKNIIKKKSLKGLSLLLISCANGETDKVTPATNAPISTENPNTLNREAIPKPHPIENKNKYSCDFAKKLLSLGRNFELTIENSSHTASPFIAINKISRPGLSPPVQVDTTIKIIVATKS